MDTASYVEEKHCSRCGETKAFVDFHRHRGQPDGRHAWCKMCRSVYAKVVVRQRNQLLAEREALASAGMQRCTTCHTVKPLNGFYVAAGKKRGVKSQCIACYRLVQVDYCARPSTVSARAAYRRERRDRDPEGARVAARRASLRAKYGISLEEYEAWITRQAGKCGCCGRSDRGVLVVDHSHVTGEIRGLLCHRCNSAIGLLGDSAEGVLRALQYLNIGPRTWDAAWTLPIT